MLDDLDMLYDELIEEVEATLNGDNPESLNGAF
jgi:hypothetical protein